MTTGHEARERKVVRRFSGLARVPSLEIVLNALPQFTGDKGMVPSLITSAVPVELACIQPITQDRMDVADGHARARATMSQASRMSLLGCFLEREISTRVPFKKRLIGRFRG